PKGRRRPEHAGGRNPLCQHLPRRSSTYVPPGDHPALRGTLTHDQIATAVIKRYEIDPVMVYVADITCPVMKITHASGAVYQETLTPPTVTGRSQVSDRFVIHSAIDKVADHLPSCRQSKRLGRIDCDIERSKICRWHIALATFLKPLWDAIFAEVQAEPVIGIDDSVHRLIVADRSVCKQGRLWAISGASGICYQFTETREGKWIADLLKDYDGHVMGDAYAGHNKLLNRDDILALFCWAHVRRKFFESADKRRRKVMLQLIGRLYDIEREIAELPPDQRVVQRQQRAQPILAHIHETLSAWQADPAILPKSGIGRATSYALKIWDGLKRYCTIGAAPIDNNRTEQGMRPNALHRKNSLFSATVKGAKSYAILLTVIQSALMHDLNPETYLNDVVEAMHHKRLPMAQLTPAAYAAREKAGCKLRS
ncbi:MAG: IS66 family transposase, partial [Planctomycetota bacterium]